MNKNSAAKIWFDNFSVSFANKRVLKNLNLQFEGKNISSIIGPSGSGKTTLLRSINRLNELEENCFIQGKLWFDLKGKYLDVNKDVDPVLLRRKIGMVFQHSNLIPGSIEKNISLALKVVLNFSKSEIEEKIVRALKKVHLWSEVKDRLKKPALQLSGGQQQRLCLARTLSLEPEVILLDEPAASLDFKSARRIEELLMELKKEYTLIVVSHGLGETRRISDKVYILSEGELVKELDKNQIKDEQFFYKVTDELF